VADPGALVSAMDKFWASDCGKKYPADVALVEEIFNGGYTSTHFIINTFQNSADQNTAAEIMRSCPDGLAFLREIAATGTRPVMQYMGAAPIDANDWGNDLVFSKFDIIVEPQHQSAYVAAYKKMTDSVAKDVDMRSYGLGVIYFGRDNFNHWAWTGARSIPELTAISNGYLSHPAYAEFNRAVGGLRTIVNTSQIQTLKGYEKQ